MQDRFRDAKREGFPFGSRTQVVERQDRHRTGRRCGRGLRGRLGGWRGNLQRLVALPQEHRCGGKEDGDRSVDRKPDKPAARRHDARSGVRPGGVRDRRRCRSRQRNRPGGRGQQRHLGGQAIAAPADARYIARMTRVVAERIAQQLRPLADRFRADDDPVPDPGHELVERHDARRRLDQREQQVERQLRQRYLGAVSQNLRQTDVHHQVPDLVAECGRHLSSRLRPGGLLSGPECVVFSRPNNALRVPVDPARRV